MHKGQWSDYENWESNVPTEITSDALWKLKAYRLSLFAADIGWSDTINLAKDDRTRALSSQLYRALGSIGANIAEGFSRASGKDRARFYEYSLGSARESRDWYFKGRYVLGAQVTEHRMRNLNDLIRLLLTMIPDQRGYRLKDKREEYVDTPFDEFDKSSGLDDSSVIEPENKLTTIPY